MIMMEIEAIIPILFLSCRYNCFLCNSDLCADCASKEATKSEGCEVLDNSLHIPGSMRSSSRRSSHTSHQLRRLSSVSQIVPHVEGSSSRKNSRCGEKCLSRRSSNIQPSLTDKNTILATKSVSRKNSSLCMDVIKMQKENNANSESVVLNFQSEIQNGKDSTENRKVNQETKVMDEKAFMIEEKTKSLLPIPYTSSDCQPKKHTLLTPSKPTRRHSSSNFLKQTSFRSSIRRTSCVPPSKTSTSPSLKDILTESK